MSLLARWMGMSQPAGAPTAGQESGAAKEEWWAQSEDRYFGMENFGNTCYANSVIQALYFCRPFRELVQLSGGANDQAHAAISTGAEATPPQASTSGSSYADASAPVAPPSPVTTPSPARPHAARAVTAPLKSPPGGSPNALRGGGMGSRMGKGKEREGTGGQSGAGKASFANVWTGSQRKPLATTGPSGAGAGIRNGTAANHRTTPPPDTRTRPATAGSTAATPPPPQAAGLPKRNFGAADMTLDQPGVGSYNPSSPTTFRQPTSDSRTTYPLDPNSSTSSDTILSTLRDLFLAISNQPRRTGAIAPHAFITTVKRSNELFRSTQHQDAHEFFNYLINTIAENVVAESQLSSSSTPSLSSPSTPTLKRSQEERPSRRRRRKGGRPGTAALEMPRPGEEGPTWVHKLFEGVLTSETRCLTCETISQRDEAFLDLSIDIEQNASVTACLRQFSRSEMLTQKNKFSCDRCGALQEAEKRMKIKKLPNVLALHLKRFKYQENLQRYMKLTYRVVFPFELRLFNTTDGAENPDRLYELWAIVVHIGAGPHHGHYVTILKSAGRWILFDDNTVTPIDESDIQKYYGDTPGTGSGYVLFYQAVDIDLDAVVEAAGIGSLDGTEVEMASEVVVADGKANGTATNDGEGIAVVVDGDQPKRPESPAPSRKESVGGTSEGTSVSDGAGARVAGRPVQHVSTAPAAAAGGVGKRKSPKPKRSLGLGLFSTPTESSTTSSEGGGATKKQRRPSTAPPSPPRAANADLRPPPAAASAPVPEDPALPTSPSNLTSSGSRFFKRPFRRPASVSLSKAATDEAPALAPLTTLPEPTAPTSVGMERDRSTQSSSRASTTDHGSSTDPTPPPVPSQSQPSPQQVLSPKQQKDLKKAAEKAAKEEAKRQKLADKERAKLEKAAARRGS